MFGRLVFVIGINVKINEVIIGLEDEIFKIDLIVIDVNFIFFDKLEKEMKVEVKIRYFVKFVKVVFYLLENGRVKVFFEEK